MNPLLQLHSYGQSYWMDTLTRGMIRSGELKTRVAEQGLRGITSNPTIFNKAISGSSDYDEQIEQLVGERRSVSEIYERLVVKDIQDACDILRPVYDESSGVDGFVSLEVSPYLAHDPEGTMEEVRRLFRLVRRPNVFIKVPGTPAGLLAIEQMLYEGVPINITLLFSIESYEAVANAYLQALERRVEEGKPIDRIASVASFFLSRIDVLVDQLLGHRIRTGTGSDRGPHAARLLGKAAIANAKLAYQSFKRLFSGERWKQLEAHGARVQRPLWASTSTKNPLYDDVRYVEPLIGPHTVNTMPEETIEAFADHGRIVENSVEAGVDEARQIFRDLEAVGIDMRLATAQLQNEGVQKFIEPFDALMKTLADKRLRFLGARVGRQTLAMGPLKKTVVPSFGILDSWQFGRRLRARDPWLWAADEQQAREISRRLGWLTSIETFRQKVDEIAEIADAIKRAGFRHTVLLGMGGSSLCPEVCRDSFGSAPGWPELLILDNTDPEAVRAVEARIDLPHTLFLVASKSGTTTETLAFARYFYERVGREVAGKAGDHFIAITDPGSPLAEEAREKGFRRCFENPEDIGGRYSALSYFGLVPAALLGINLGDLLDRAYQTQQSFAEPIPAEANPATSLGTLLGIGARHGRDKVTFVLSPAIGSFGAWAEQLLAESTGKQGRGLIPVDGEPLGPPEVYGDDRLFVAVRTADGGLGEAEERLSALERNGCPVVRIDMPDAMSLGGEFFRWETATATAGSILGVNPFDEPDVAESKHNTRERLREWKEKRAFGEGTRLLEENGVTVYCERTELWGMRERRDTLAELLAAFLASARAPDYLALLPYFLRTGSRHEILQRIRLRLRDKLKVATTLGYGPRYLHSTGQLHKGGPNIGYFLMFTADAREEIAIPGEDFGFATLQRAQALGDFQSLNQKGRWVMRIHLGREIEQGLAMVERSIDGGGKADH